MGTTHRTSRFRFPNHSIHEIWTAGPEVQPLPHLLSRQLLVLGKLGAQAARNSHHEQWPDPWESSAGVQKCHVLDALEDDVNPRMIRAILQAPERFAERQVANDIERREIEPPFDIDRPRAALRSLMQLAEELVDVVLDDRLLCQHRLRGESVGQYAAETLMVLAVGADDVVPVRNGIDSVLGVLARLPMTADILHAIWVVDGKVRRTDADDRAVLLVKSQYLTMTISGGVEADVGDV